jgi:diguanylate cyclase (GGDEF)-like protein
MMDIDAFKAFNDRYGHTAGDTCLGAVGHALHDLAQGRGGLVARYGGEEFIWVLPDADLARARSAAETALEAVRGLKIPHDASPCADIVSLSIGVWASTPGPGDEPGGMIAEADGRLYLAKRAGRNRIE